MADMSLLPPRKRARRESSCLAAMDEAWMEGASTDKLCEVMGLAKYVHKLEEDIQLEYIRILNKDVSYPEDIQLGYIRSLNEDVSYLGSPWIPELITPISGFPSKIQSNPEPQTQPQLQLQQLVGLDLQNCGRQILLLSATDVFETLMLRLNHYLKKLYRSDESIPSSYSDMVFLLHKSKLSPRCIKAMDDVESEFLRDLEDRKYGSTEEHKGQLRKELTAYLTKAKGEGGRNYVAHPFSTSINQEWNEPSEKRGNVSGNVSRNVSRKVRCLLDTTIDGLTQSQKDDNLQILDLLSNSQNIPKRYRDLAEVAFPLQIFFLRDVLKKSKVKVETVGDQ